jgi:hypothetical protein
MIEKYFSKNIDDKKLIFIKFNLIYWFEYELFDVLQLMNIEIYLYFTIYEMNSFYCHDPVSLIQSGGQYQEELVSKIKRRGFISSHNSFFLSHFFDLLLLVTR